jgi:hypothetical protein
MLLHVDWNYTLLRDFVLFSLRYYCLFYTSKSDLLIHLLTDFLYICEIRWRSIHVDKFEQTWADSFLYRATKMENARCAVSLSSSF